MILVTGGAGYIGSHFVLACQDAGLPCVVLDDLSTGSRASVPPDVPFVRGDIADAGVLGRLFRDWPVTAVVHLAASISVPESIAAPELYWSNNAAKTLALLSACRAQGVEQVVFASTAAVYGMPATDHVFETDRPQPISPYGRSKLASEWLLEDLSRAGMMRTASLRFFNVAGSDPAGRARGGAPTARHLIAEVRRVAMGERSHLEIYGVDYDTRDGTCIRDFIHVTDLCRALLVSHRALAEGHSGLTLNVGTGTGISVGEIVAAASGYLGRALPQVIQGRRPGDIPSLVAEAGRLKEFGWIPQHSAPEDIIRTALAA